LTGKFDELAGSYSSNFNARSLDSGLRPGTQYGATDKDRKRIMEWAKEERVSAFLK